MEGKIKRRAEKGKREKNGRGNRNGGSRRGEKSGKVEVESRRKEKWAA